ncbi:MAG: hypothetical protein GY777_19925 [Candidatus Brocadiaceae bacterium]|nr:hypothetical protein [Candidatus Brocadiaceae bacterium]
MKNRKRVQNGTHLCQAKVRGGTLSWLSDFEATIIAAAISYYHYHIFMGSFYWYFQITKKIQIYIAPICCILLKKRCNMI